MSAVNYELLSIFLDRCVEFGLIETDEEFEVFRQYALLQVENLSDADATLVLNRMIKDLYDA